MDAAGVQNGAVNPITESTNPSTNPEPAASKPVNPLRLARPLEKTPLGLSKTTIPQTRPMPMPTISPLCPPGSNQGKNGLKSVPPKNGNISTLAVPAVPASQPLKANIPQESLGTGDGSVDDTKTAISKESKQYKGMEGKQKLVPPKKSMSPIPSNAAPPKVSPVHEKDMVTPKAISDGARRSSDGPKVPVAEKTPRQKKRKKEQESEVVPDEEKRLSKRARAPPAVYESPDPEMARLLKTIKKQEDEERRAAGKTSPNDVEEGKIVDNNTDQVSDKNEEKEEEEEMEEEEEEEKKEEKKEKVEKVEKVEQVEKVEEEDREEEEEEEEQEEKEEKKKGPSVKRKRKKIVAREESDEDEDEEDDDDYQPKEVKPKPPKSPKTATAKKRGRKPKSEASDTSSKKKTKRNDPVFFKDEYLAVRNDEGTFFLCKAMQNIYLGSRNITIQWLSNEDPLVPAKDNPDGDIFAHDFYDKTEFETILTSVELDKVLGKSKRMILPGEELARINKILQRAHDKADGKLDLSNFELTEDNPDGLDISLYKGEDQLDEIDARRAGTKEEKEVKEIKPKKTKAASVKKVEKADKIQKKEEKGEANKVPITVEAKSEDAKSEEATSEGLNVAENNCVDAMPDEEAEKVVVEAKPEVKKKAKGRPKKEPVSSESLAKNDKIENNENVKNENGETEAEEGQKKERRRATKNICYDQFDFLEEEDDEVMPVPKKRKSQDSMTAPDETNPKEEKTPDVQVKDNEEKAENQGEEKSIEELSTSERVILAEKAKMEAEAKQNAEPPTSDNQQPVKKRGRKPKPKE
eukprot:GFUD01024296.1.p1 GENE.GFUD01024296.1~~GFUD01024296.1.p1  ORF type:complete len:806 (+),score=315.96 GFUD01024296.1:321-2738(+)